MALICSRRLVTASLLLALFAHAAPAYQDSHERARQAYTRALDLESRGDAAGALSLLWEAAGLAPRDAEIQNRLGEALDRVGAFDAAIDTFRRALAERPDFRKAANNLILTLVKAGRGPEAVERARALVAAAPGDPNALFTLGLAQSEQDVSGALATLQRVVALEPRHTLARYNLALILKRADRITEAIEQLTRVIDTEPRPEAHYTLGVIYWQQGDATRAATALRAAIAARPGFADAHYTLGAVLHGEGELPAAADALRRAVALRPDLTGAHYTLARVLQQAGDVAAARAHLTEAERLRSRAQLEQEARVSTSVGARRLESGDVAGAVSQFERATEIFDGYAPAHYQLGLALRRLGRREASRAAFARAQRLNPSLVPPRDP